MCDRQPRIGESGISAFDFIRLTLRFHIDSPRDYVGVMLRVGLHSFGAFFRGGKRGGGGSQFL